MKSYNKNKESPYLQYWDVNNLCTRKMLQKLPVNNFEWIEDTSQFHEDFITNYNEKGDERCFLKVNVQYTERLLERFTNGLPFLPERVLKKSKNFYLTYMTKMNILCP